MGKVPAMLSRILTCNRRLAVARRSPQALAAAKCDSIPLTHKLRRDWAVTRRFMMKHLAQVTRIDALAAHAAAVRKLALVRERRVELFGDPAGERVVEFESVKLWFADHIP
jgi:hypothetical protein